MTFVALLILYSAVVPIGLFIGFYAARSNWRATGVGKIIMGLQVCIFLILVAGLLNFVVDPAWFDWVRIIVYPLTVLGFWRMWWELMKIQRGSGQERRRRETETETETD